MSERHVLKVGNVPPGEDPLKKIVTDLVMLVIEREQPVELREFAVKNEDGSLVDLLDHPVGNNIGKYAHMIAHRIFQSTVGGIEVADFACGMPKEDA